ncbi:unnamed protein product [Urochloa humidicola]
MGFPVGYSEMVVPRALLQVVLLLGHLHRFLLWAFHAVGLGDLIDLPDAAAAELVGEPTPPQPQVDVPAVLVDEALPVVRFQDLALGLCGDADADCAVCLCAIAADDEVRRLSNCRHAFHRGCLDRWMAHDQRTCPLCRAPLIPGGGGTTCRGEPWADYDTPLLTVATPTLLRPHELLLNGLGGFQ